MKSQAASRYCWLLFLFFARAAKEHLGAPYFQPRTIYQYRYSLNSELNYLSSLSLQGSQFQAEALVHVHLLWRNTKDVGEQLLQVQIHDLQTQHNLDHKKTVKSDPSLKNFLNATELQQPVFVHWNNGKVESIYEDKAGSPLTLEVKRGLISLLQFQPSSGTVTEEDISGSCQVTYYKTSEDSVLKTKDLLSCIRPKFGFSSVNKMFGVLWQPTSKSLYSMKGHLITTVSLEENHVISLALKSSVGVNITSRQHLELVIQEPESKDLLENSLQEALSGVLTKPQLINIVSEPSKRACARCPQLKTYLRTLVKKKAGMDVSKVSTTWQFHRVVRMLRDANKSDILRLLKKAPENMLPFYVDAAVAAQSTACLKALSELLDFGNKKQTRILEKFLYAAALSPRPSKELLRLVLDKLNGKRLDSAIWEMGNLVIGSLVGKLCRMKLCGLEEVGLGMETILQRLHSTKEDSERVIYMLSLKNALLPETIPTLLHYAEEGSPSVSVAAISALQRFSSQHISSEVKMVMKRIFHQILKRYDKNSRLAAVEILLDNEPSAMDFTNVLLATRELEPEMSRFLMSKIQSIVHSHHHPTRQVITDIMKDPQINNYYSLASKIGISTIFSGPLAVTNDSLSNYSLQLLFTEHGLLRKSTTSFSVLSHGHQLQVAQMASEIKGLDSMLGSSTTNGEEEELMTGMSVVLFDVQMRPVPFFQGYTDLMTKFLMSSGEPTNVVKGNVLLMDHQQAIPLQSGLQGVITLQGGLGLDVSANVNVNLWEQEFKIGVTSRAAMTIDFQAEVDAPFFQATVKNQIEAETAIKFDTAARITESPMPMCLQLIEEQMSWREIYSLSEASANHSTILRKGRRTLIPGRELPFHRANSEMCKILLVETI